MPMSPRFRLRKDRTLPILVEGEDTPSSFSKRFNLGKGRKARSRDLQSPHVLIRVCDTEDRGDVDARGPQRDGYERGEEKTEGEHLDLLLGAIRKEFPDMPIHVHSSEEPVATQAPVRLLEKLDVRSDRDEQSSARSWNDQRGGDKVGSVSSTASVNESTARSWTDHRSGVSAGSVSSGKASVNDELSWNPSYGGDRAFKITAQRKTREEHRQRVSMNDDFWEDFSGSEFPFGFDFPAQPSKPVRTSLRNTTNQLTATSLKTLPTSKPVLRHSGKYSRQVSQLSSKSQESLSLPRDMESYPRSLSAEEYPELRKKTSFAALPVPPLEPVADVPTSEQRPRTPNERRFDEDGYATDDGVSQILGNYQPSPDEIDEASLSPETDAFGLDPNFGEIDSDGPFGSLDVEDGSYATDTEGSETEEGDEETEEGDEDDEDYEDEEEDTQSDYYLETTSTFETVSKSLPSVMLDVIGDAVSSLLADIEKSDRARPKSRAPPKVATRGGKDVPRRSGGTPQGAKPQHRTAKSTPEVAKEKRRTRRTSYE